MSRQPSTSREELLEGILEHLAGRGIAGLTFRSLAASLGLSTFPLYYYFGSKAGLLDAVVAEVERRQREVVDQVVGEDGAPDADKYWEWCLQSRDLLRVEFEILLQESRADGGARPLADAAFRDWHRLWTEHLIALGYEAEEAETRATLIVATSVGLQLDLIATGDDKRTSRAAESLAPPMTKKSAAPKEQPRQVTERVV